MGKSGSGHRSGKGGKGQTKGHHYLNELGIPSDNVCIYNTKENDKYRKKRHRKAFKRQREKYGFDERETYDLDFTLVGWTYSHLMWYRQNAPIDMTEDRFCIPVLRKREKGQKDEIRDGALCEPGDGRLREPRDGAFREVTEEHDMGECIDIALKYMRRYLTTMRDSPRLSDCDYARAQESARCAMRIVAEIQCRLQW